MSLSSAIEELIERVRGRLEPDGWIVSVEESDTGEALTISVEHTLTSGAGFGLGTHDASEETAFVETSLAKREYELISRRPDPCPHAALIGSVRAAAQANGWDLHTVTVISYVLRDQGLLSEVEAEWLEEAGPAWWPDHQPPWSSVHPPDARREPPWKT